MDITFFHIFKKNGLLLALIFFCFLIVKTFTLSTLLTAKNNEKIDEWVTVCSSYDSEKLSNFISLLGSEVLTDERSDKTILYQYSQLNASFKNYKKVSNLIVFANQLEGELPTVLPYDYMNRLDFYKKIDYPSVINEDKLDNYFELQRYDIISFVVVILVAIFGGMHYETDMYKFTQITIKGRAYFRNTKVVIFVICMSLLLINELIDLLFSDLLWDGITLSATIQSYSVFSNSQLSLSIGECILYTLLIKMVGLYLLTQITYSITCNFKNTKDSIITSFSLFLVCYLLGESISETRYYPFLLFGIVDWQKAIKNTVVIRPLGMSTLTIGFLIILLLAAFMSLKPFVSYLKKIK